MKISKIVMRRSKEFPMSQTAGEQERNLWITSRRYVLGEIEIGELEAVEFAEAENFKHAVWTLAKRRLQQRFHHRFLKIWKFRVWRKQDSQQLYTS